METVLDQALSSLMLWREALDASAADLEQAQQVCSMIAAAWC